MKPEYHIHYLRRQEIQDARWDACIGSAPNGLIYGRSFYLDHMTDGQWDALVLDDYKAVMPLTWKNKWGIRYLYQPSFTQQLGIFSSVDLPSPHSPSSASPSSIAPGFPASPTPGAASPTHSPGVPVPPGPATSASPGVPAALTEAFLTRAGTLFRFAEIFLNHGNAHPSLEPHANFILALDAPYELLAENYKKGLVGSLKTASRLPLQYNADPDLLFCLRLNRSRYEDRTPHVKNLTYKRFEKLCLSLQERGQAMVRAITGPDGQPLATALLLEERGRLSLLQATTLPEGRRAGANHLLLDNIIREFSGKGRILDFEGSDIAGIAHFYRSFGSVDQPYFFHRHNRLPWPLRLLK